MQCKWFFGSDRCLLDENHTERHMADWGGAALRWSDADDFSHFRSGAS